MSIPKSIESDSSVTILVTDDSLMSSELRAELAKVGIQVESARGHLARESQLDPDASSLDSLSKSVGAIFNEHDGPHYRMNFKTGKRLRF